MFVLFICSTNGEAYTLYVWNHFIDHLKPVEGPYLYKIAQNEEKILFLKKCGVPYANYFTPLKWQIFHFIILASFICFQSAGWTQFYNNFWHLSAILRGCTGFQKCSAIIGKIDFLTYFWSKLAGNAKKKYFLWPRSCIFICSNGKLVENAQKLVKITYMRKSLCEGHFSEKIIWILKKPTLLEKEFLKTLIIFPISEIHFFSREK